jgi:cation transport ATPase
MTKLLISVSFMFGALSAPLAQAEEKTCAVKGMHCEACTESVQAKVCEEGKYSQCEVKITDGKKEMGQIHMVTKDAAAKIDEKALGAQVKDAGYDLQKCKASAGKADAKKAKG